MFDCCGGGLGAEKKTGPGKEPSFDLLSVDFSPEESQPSCCDNASRRFDYVLWVSLILFFGGIFVRLFFPIVPAWLEKFSLTCIQLASQTWWAVAAGIIAMAVLSKTPKELVASILGRPGTMSGIFRAIGAGVMLDLCNHGILMVGMGLYKRGASLGQTIAFLIASPWNSLSLTLLLAALIGWKWMLTFLLLSAVIAAITGFLVELLTRRGKLPVNNNSITLPRNFSLRTSLREMARALSPHPANIASMLLTGFKDSRMILRWILMGFVLTSLVNAFVPEYFLHKNYGPTFAGLMLTLLTTTLLEVCSEGSTPLAAALFHRAGAPGNAFAFLMAGAATDYTEIMALKSTTGRWLSALILPILSIPQVVLFAMLLNQPFIR
jgi:uncharacterized membrane protein YraQ (UPF0718 family)